MPSMSALLFRGMASAASARQRTASLPATWTTSTQASSTKVLPVGPPLAKRSSSSSRAHDRILLSGLLFHGFHGVYTEEQALGQKFLVDAALHCDLRAAGRTDLLGDTINYAEVYRQIKTIMEGEPRQLLESVAHDICSDIFAAHPLVHGVELTIKKPHVAVAGPVDFLGVQVLRWRSDMQ